MKLNPIARTVQGRGEARHEADGCNASPHRGAHPAGRGEPAGLHRRPRTLLPGDRRGLRRRHPAGALPGGLLRPPAAGRPLPPGQGERGPRRGRPPAAEGWGAGVVHGPAAQGAGVPAPAHLPGRRPAGPGLRPPDLRHRLPVRPGGRGAGGQPDQARVPRSRLVQPAPGEDQPQASVRPQYVPIHDTGPDRPHQRRDADGPGVAGPAGAEGLLLDTERGDLEGRPAGAGRRVPWRPS